MDCIIPDSSIRPFFAAISCLSKVGKELYVDFDPFDGLSLRALNDSKSVFGNFHYEPSFFTHCQSSSLSSSSSSSKTGNRNNKKRKRSRGRDGNNGTTTQSQNDDDGDDSDSSNDDYEDGEEGGEEADSGDRWTVRIAMKALLPMVRSRKDVLHLHLLTVGDHLAFEFHIQRPDDNAGGGGPKTVRIVHKVGYAPANGVAAVAPMDDSSELVIQPHVLATMVEPLKRSIEIAIIVNETHKLVSSVTFSHDDLPNRQQQQQSSAASLMTRQQQQASLKTEVSVKYDDLVDVHYNRFAGLDGGNDDDDDDSSGSDTDDGRQGSLGPNRLKRNRNRNGSGQSQQPTLQPPANLKEQAILVFTLKEFRAFLQFCAQAVVDQELQLTLQFHWGGRPMVLKTAGENFHGDLFMATLDHNLLGDMRTSNTTTSTTSNNDTTNPAASDRARAQAPAVPAGYKTP